MKNSICLLKYIQKFIKKIQIIWPNNLFINNHRIPMISIAISGGVDSSMLNIIIDCISRERKILFKIFYVNHNILTISKKWFKNIKIINQKIKKNISNLYIKIFHNFKYGIESNFRESRYISLINSSLLYEVNIIFLAHNYNDKIENIILRFLRGSNKIGLFSIINKFINKKVILLRPFLNIYHNNLLKMSNDYTKFYGFVPIIDSGNLNLTYSRSLLRSKIIPILDINWQNWKKKFQNYSYQFEESNFLLKEIALIDLNFLELAVCKKNIKFSLQLLNFKKNIKTKYKEKYTYKRKFKININFLRILSPFRQRNILRYIINLLIKKLPSTKFILNIQNQLIKVHKSGFDRNLKINSRYVKIFCKQGIAKFKKA